jgi:hypothetical protein
MIRRGLPLLLALSLGCAATGEPETAASPIVNGEREYGFPSVVGVGVDSEDFGWSFAMCSGNLITPRLVLSAAHCGNPEEFGLSQEIWDNLIASYGVAFFGDDTNDPEFLADLQEIVVHPDYEHWTTANGDMTSYDFAVGVLAAPVEDIEPILVRADDVTDEDVGATVVSVGIGYSEWQGGDFGVKYSAEMTIDDYDEMFVVSNTSTNPGDANINNGDSGGPQMFEEGNGRYTQWAVHSLGSPLASWSTRTDRVDEWLLDLVEEVHGTRDLCAVNALYDDGICDEFCEEWDLDCGDPPDAGDDDTAEGEDEGGCQCSAPAGRRGPTRGGILFGLSALLALRLTRRRGSPCHSVGSSARSSCSR